MSKATGQDHERPLSDDPGNIYERLKEGKVVIPAVERDMANPAWDEAAARILIVRLSPWRDVDISTPHLVLFDEIRLAMKNAYVDFAFMPTAADRKSLSSRNLPWFFGRASRKSPSDFDLIMVSNAFALELINLPYLFSTSGLPLSALSRANLEKAPIVIAGGSNAAAMGSIVLEAPGKRFPAKDSFVDGIFFGEGEGAIGRLALILSGQDPENAALAADRPAGAAEGGIALAADRPAGAAGGGIAPANAAARAARLLRAGAVEGFWPCLYSEGTKKAKAAGRPRTIERPLILNGSNASSARLSITSGCPGYCSFCLEGWDRSPYAEADLDSLLASARRLRKATGASDLEIYSFNFNTHSRIFELIFELNRIFRKVSFMSQRLDILAETKGLIDAEFAGGKRSYTLGIEGISKRMRAFYRKGLADENIATSLDMTLRRGVKEIKLFFIISGREDQTDIDEFASMMAMIGGKKASGISSARIIVSAGYLVRLPFTPLQYEAPDFDEEKLKRISYRMNEACEKAGLEFRLASDIEEGFVDQALSLAGSAIYPWLEKIPDMRIVYDSTLGKDSWKSLRPYLWGKTQDRLFLSEKPENYRPPLAFIEEGERFSVLHRHYLEAKDCLDRPPCLGKACSGCGACDDPSEIGMMTGHSPAVLPNSSWPQKIEALLLAKSKFPPVFVEVDLPPDLSGAEASYRRSWILRQLSNGVEGVEAIVFDVKETMFSEGTPFAELFKNSDNRFGGSVLALYGPDKKKIEIAVSRLMKNGSTAKAGPAASGELIVKKLPSSAVEPSLMWIELRIDSGKSEAVHRAFEAFAAKNGLSHTTLRTEKGWSYRFSPASSGRRLFSEARLETENRSAILSISTGEKTTLSPLMETIEEACGERVSAKIVGWN